MASSGPRKRQKERLGPRVPERCKRGESERVASGSIRNRLQAVGPSWVGSQAGASAASEGKISRSKALSPKQSQTAAASRPHEAAAKTPRQNRPRSRSRQPQRLPQTAQKKFKNPKKPKLPQKHPTPVPGPPRLTRRLSGIMVSPSSPPFRGGDEGDTMIPMPGAVEAEAESGSERCECERASANPNEREC